MIHDVNTSSVERNGLHLQNSSSTLGQILPHTNIDEIMTLRTVFSITIVALVAIPLAYAQQKPSLPEPPLPVVTICPFHADSLRAAHEGMFGSKHSDSLLTMVVAANQHTTSTMNWIYGLLILLTMMNIVIFVVLLQMRRQLKETISSSGQHSV